MGPQPPLGCVVRETLSLVFAARPSVPRPILKPSELLQEGETYSVGRAIALLGNDQFGFAFQVGIVRLINFFAEDECHNIGVLLDGTRFTQIGKLRTVITSACLRSAAQL